MRASRRADARVARDLRDRLEVDAALSGLSNMSAFADIGRPLNASCQVAYHYVSMPVAK